MVVNGFLPILCNDINLQMSIKQTCTVLLQIASDKTTVLPSKHTRSFGLPVNLVAYRVGNGEKRDAEGGTYADGRWRRA